MVKHDRNRQLARATVRLLEFGGVPPHPDLLALSGQAGTLTGRRYRWLAYGAHRRS